MAIEAHMSGSHKPVLIWFLAQIRLANASHLWSRLRNNYRKDEHDHETEERTRVQFRVFARERQLRGKCERSTWRLPKDVPHKLARAIESRLQTGYSLLLRIHMLLILVHYHFSHLELSQAVYVFPSPVVHYYTVLSRRGLDTYWGRYFGLGRAMPKNFKRSYEERQYGERTSESAFHETQGASPDERSSHDPTNHFIICVTT
ncbi:hypothetical protein V8E53_000721 [Lactarius tabidus]